MCIRDRGTYYLNHLRHQLVSSGRDITHLILRYRSVDDEVIKVVGTQVYVQVFESTRGLKVGAEAEFTGHMLEVTDVYKRQAHQAFDG